MKMKSLIARLAFAAFFALASTAFSCGSDDGNKSGGDDDSAESERDDEGEAGDAFDGDAIDYAAGNYRITIVSANVPEWKIGTATVQYWDENNGNPDCYATMALNGALLGQTTVKQDSLAPVWNESFNVTGLTPDKLTASDKIDFEIWDEDDGASEIIATITMTGAEFKNSIQYGGYNYSNQDIKVKLTIRIAVSQ